MAMKMGKAKTKGEMKTGLEGLNVILSRLKLEKPSMDIIFDPNWQHFVGQVEFEGHRLQSKGPSLKVVRDDLCDKMIRVIDNMETYTGKKKTKGRGPSENMLYKRKRRLKRDKLITKLENLGIGTKLCPGCKLKDFSKFPTCLRCKSDISGVEESQKMTGGGTRNDTGPNLSLIHI